MFLKETHFSIIHELSQLSRRLRFELIMEPAVASQEASKSNNTRTYVGIIIHVENISTYSTKLGQNIPKNNLVFRFACMHRSFEPRTKQKKMHVAVCGPSKEKERENPIQSCQPLYQAVPHSRKGSHISESKPRAQNYLLPPSLSLAARKPLLTRQDPQIPSPEQPHCAAESTVPTRKRSLPSKHAHCGVSSFSPSLSSVDFLVFFFLLPLFLRRRLLGEWQPLHLLAELACG
jgi:hypothetical protein